MYEPTYITNDIQWKNHPFNEIKEMTPAKGLSQAELINQLTLESAKIDDMVDQYVQTDDDLARLAKRSCKKCLGRGRIIFVNSDKTERKVACDCVVRNLRKLL